jgi:VanZ family protein
VQRFLKYWFPLLFWLAVMFFGSTDLMSAAHTSRFIVPFLLWLKPGISPEALASINFIFRKCAHVAEHAILALLLLRVAIYATNRNWPLPLIYAGVWLACLAVAATDEFHQTFVASRSASTRDIMIDSAGAILGLFIGAGLRMGRFRPLKGTWADL